MATVSLMLRAIAALCFLLAAIGIPSPRVNLIGLGLLLWVLATMVP